MSLKAWLQSHPFTLTMSSGFFSFFAHCGMVSVLENEGLYPARITGSSAGALIGVCWASGCSVSRIKEALFNVSKADFWDPGLGLGLLKGKRFRSMIGQLACVAELEQCSIPVAISVSEMGSRIPKVFTTGPLVETVYASCAVPLLFQPLRWQGRYYVDGGLLDRHGLAGTRNGDRIFYHHIASRSPWRRKNSPALQVPTRWNMASLVIADLPRCGPNRLDQGPLAYAQARQGMQWALRQRVDQEQLLRFSQDNGFSTQA